MNRHCALLAALLPALCVAAADQVWRADLATTEVRNLYLRHGESADLTARLYLRGTPYAPTNAVAYYQTNGMAQAWWSAPCSIASNTVSVAWTPALDPGADLVSLLIRLDDSAYRAAAMLYLRPSPGAEPNILPAPTQWIDFDKVAWTNAPWALSGHLHSIHDVTNIVPAITLGPRQLSGWSYEPDTVLRLKWISGDIDDLSMRGWWPCSPSGSIVGTAPVETDEHAVVATFFDEGVGVVTASRSPLPGYVLGKQSDRPLADADEFAAHATNMAIHISAVDREAWMSAIDERVPYDIDSRSNLTAVTIGNRIEDSIVGHHSFAQGSQATASGGWSHAEGSSTIALGQASHAEGRGTSAVGDWSHAAGMRSMTAHVDPEGGENIPDDYAFAWQGVRSAFPTPPVYHSHGPGTYNINPVDGPAGFWIGEMSFIDHVKAVAPAPGDYATVSNRAMSALQSFTESDPTVPSWAKDPAKPTYTATEVGAATATHQHAITDVTNFPALAQVATSGSYADLSDKPAIPTIPTVVSAFSNDVGYLYTEIDPTVPSWAKAPDPPSGGADMEDVSNLVAQVVGEAGQSAAATETWRIILADHQRRLDALEDADGTDALTEAQAEQLIQDRMDTLLHDIEEEWGETSGCIPIQTTTCNSTTISANTSGVAANLSPLYATRYYASTASDRTLGFSSFSGVGNNPCILILERFSSVSWPSGARIETAYSYNSGTPNVYAVYQLNGVIYAKRLYP